MRILDHFTSENIDYFRNGENYEFFNTCWLKMKKISLMSLQ